MEPSNRNVLFPFPDAHYSVPRSFVVSVRNEDTKQIMRAGTDGLRMSVQTLNKGPKTMPTAFTGFLPIQPSRRAKTSEFVLAAYRPVLSGSSLARGFVPNKRDDRFEDPQP